jgi:hypothetical protein
MHTLISTFQHPKQSTNDPTVALSLRFFDRLFLSLRTFCLLLLPCRDSGLCLSVHYTQPIGKRFNGCFTLFMCHVRSWSARCGPSARMRYDRVCITFSLLAEATASQIFVCGRTMKIVRSVSAKDRSAIVTPSLDLDVVHRPGPGGIQIWTRRFIP